jgi:uncharacterized protein DUF4394/HYR domain-containing protein
MKKARFRFSSIWMLTLLTAFLLTTGAIGRFAEPGSAAMMFNPDTIYALSTTNSLISFDSATPGTVSGPIAISGLVGGETIMGIDFRPATGQLYALSNQSRLYIINRATGAATAVGSGFTPALSGTEFGFDFNPTVDRIRVVSDADQNFRLNPVTGTVAGSDVNLVYAMGDANQAANPNVVGAAYTNNFNGATTTTLYDIDSVLDILTTQGSPNATPVSPNAGQLFTVGALVVDTTPLVGFDISTGGTAFASLTTGATPAFYTINLTSGAATRVGTIGGGLQIRDIAVFLPCVLTCPPSITRSNDPGQCGAVVTYSPPTTSGECGAISCAPPSGSFFSVGTTTVTCNATGGGSCPFTITVNDIQPPSITCPGNVTAVTPVTCPPSNSTIVNFANPVGSNGCPGVTTSCTPPSGSIFALGATTVNCTATDTSGNTATCSFSVTVFNGCLQDDSDPKNVVLFNTVTGEYRFCCGGTIFTGIASVLGKGCTFTLQHNAVDRRALIGVDFAVRSGKASLQSPPGSTKCTIMDRNITNNTCACP